MEEVIHKCFYHHTLEDCQPGTSTVVMPYTMLVCDRVLWWLSTALLVLCFLRYRFACVGHNLTLL